MKIGDRVFVNSNSLSQRDRGKSGTIASIVGNDVWVDMGDVSAPRGFYRESLTVIPQVEEQLELPLGLPEAEDLVNHPKHYKDRVPGIECIEVTKHFDFLRGNAIKYVWRAGLKGDDKAKEIEDLEKAVWYLNTAIEELRNG